MSNTRRRVRLALGWYHYLYHRGVARYAQEAGWHLWSAQALHTTLHAGWTGDGFITNGVVPGETGLLMRMAHLPTVTLDLKLDRENVGRVVSDYDAVGRLAFEHFRQRGFEQFAWYSRYGSEEYSRAVAFEREVKQAGLMCQGLAWFLEEDDRPKPSITRRKWLESMVARLPLPIAIFAVNDAEAVDVLEACEACGLVVPDQVAVMGVGNTEEICAYSPVPLTSIDVSREACGYAAAQLLDRMMNGHAPPAEPIMVPLTGVVPRLSTDIIAVGHKQVAHAVRFIWGHAHENISIDQVAEAVGMSRRALFASFRKHLDRTPHQELMRRRLETATAMLRDSDQRISDIRDAAGFSSLTHLYQAFQRVYGMSPRAYRQKHRRADGEASAHGKNGSAAHKGSKQAHGLET